MLYDKETTLNLSQKLVSHCVAKLYFGWELTFSGKESEKLIGDYLSFL